MIDDDFLSGLPADPEEAFALFEAELRAKTDSRIGPEGEGSEDSRRLYVIELQAFAAQYSVPFEFDLNHVLATDTATFWNRFSDLETQVRIFVAHGRYKRAAQRRASPSAFVVLETAEKQKIQTYLAKIRDIVDESDLPEAKKEAIRRRLTELQQEIDRGKTRAEAAFAAYLVVKREMGKAGDSVVDLLDKIVTVLAKATPLIEAIKGPAEQKKLPAPKKPEKEAAAPSFDDEIPF